MSVHVEADRVRLEGDCGLQDAEPLCAALVGHGGRCVDLSGALSLHTAVVQALLALRPKIEGEPADPFLRAHVLNTPTLP